MKRCELIYFTSIRDGVIKDPVTIQTVEVYSPADPERVIKIIGNGNVAEDVKHVTANDIIRNNQLLLKPLRRNRNNRRHRPLRKPSYPFSRGIITKPIPYRFISYGTCGSRTYVYQDTATVTPQQLVNIRPVVAAIKEFFGSSQLSQFMDQTNPLGG